jgi:hypothetical protein
MRKPMCFLKNSEPQYRNFLHLKSELYWSLEDPQTSKCFDLMLLPFCHLGKTFTCSELQLLVSPMWIQEHLSSRYANFGWIKMFRFLWLLSKVWIAILWSFLVVCLIMREFHGFMDFTKLTFCCYYIKSIWLSFTIINSYQQKNGVLLWCIANMHAFHFCTLFEHRLSWPRVFYMMYNKLQAFPI